MKDYEQYKAEEILRLIKHYRDLSKQYYNDTGTKFMPILMEDYNLIISKAKTGFLTFKENKRIKEIEERYEELVRDMRGWRR